MEKYGSLSKALKDIDNGDYIAIFNMGGEYLDDVNFVKKLMIDSNGIYAVSHNDKKLFLEYNYLQQAKLVLFYNTSKHVYFAWGILEKYKDGIKNEEAWKYGPYKTTEEMESNPTSLYKDFILDLNGNSTGRHYGKLYYKFWKAELLNCNIQKSEFVLDKKNKESYRISAVKFPEKLFIGRPCINVVEVINKERLEELLLRILFDKNAINIGNLNDSLIGQVDYYGLENVHTAFFKNFIKIDNIYNLNDKPMKKFINLINKKIKKDESLKKYYEKIVGKFTTENYTVLSQNKYGQGVQPDIVLESSNYRIIVEVKYKSFEHENQTWNYYKFFNDTKEIKGVKNNKKNIYVFLYLGKTTYENLSGDKYKNKYIKISFKEIVNELYNNYRNESKILKDYMNSFPYAVDDSSGVNIDISEIPYVSGLYNTKSIYTLVKKFNKDKKSKITFDDYNLFILFRYLLVLLYNEIKDTTEKKHINDLYNRARYRQE